MNNSILTKFYFDIIGRANIKGSKSNITMNAWLPQVSYLCSNFSDTSSLKFQEIKKSIDYTFIVCIYTKNQNQGDLYSFILLKISVLDECLLEHLCYLLIDILPQLNFPPENIFNLD